MEPWADPAKIVTDAQGRGKNGVVKHYLLVCVALYGFKQLFVLTVGA